MTTDFIEQRERIGQDVTLHKPNHSPIAKDEFHRMLELAHWKMAQSDTSKRTKPRFLGVDVGSKTGLALWDQELGDFLFMGTYSYWRAVWAALGMVNPYIDVIIVEDPGLNKHQHNLAPGDTKRKAASKGQDAGRVMQDTRRFIEFFRLLGFAVWQAKVNRTKLDLKDWRDHTGASGLWVRRGITSEHARDAGIYSGYQSGTIKVWRQKCDEQAAG